MRKDAVIVVDLEATCWKKDPPPGQQSEIIEVGVCLLNLETLEASHKRSLIVKPTRSTVSVFCAKLTGITAEMAEAGTTFDAAVQVLIDEYDSPNRLWSSWGGYDQRMFKHQCDGFNVPYPFSEHHLNIKQLYGDVRNKGKRVGMARALKMEQMPLEGRHHRGDDDAWNTALILAKLLREDSKAILPEVVQ